MAASSNLTSLQFQFTHPGKGATVTRTQTHIISCVSIHAPWEGCDLSLTLNTLPKVCFNSRTLGRVRLSTSIFRTCLGSFNSRTLGRVRRYRRCLPSSIRCFNSRTLGRVRRTALSCTCKSGLFQFTHPGKGATLITTNNKWGISTFQFTHPGKGATGHEVRLHHSEPFQFTHPGKGAT